LQPAVPKELVSATQELTIVNTVIAIKLARAVYFMLKNKTIFDPERLVAALQKAAA
jgi:hypothetical protein